MSDVSRETSELRQRYAAFPQLEEYAGILSTRGVEHGLLGPREVPRLWSRHLANCAVVAEEARVEIPPAARVVDVGSGAGLPGIVWAVVRPDLTVALVEPLLRRSRFLTDVVAELGLDGRVEVVRARAEEVPGGSFDVVTARAVARLDRLVPWLLPLVRVGGTVVAFKGRNAQEEVTEAADIIRRAGGGVPEIRSFGDRVVDPPTTVVMISRIGAGVPGSPSGPHA